MFVRYWSNSDKYVGVDQLGRMTQSGHRNGSARVVHRTTRDRKKPRRSGAFKSLLRVGVLGNAVVDEVTPLQEVDGGEFLGGLSFA